MQNQLSFVYTRYFSTLQKVALTTLRVLENRILPSAITFAHEWNDDSPVSVAPPLFVPRIAPNDGFTAVILTHYNVHSTFNHIRLLAKVPSLSKIIIVWNGDERKPPPESEWPHISRPVQVIQMKDTLVTNRYIVFREISTEAVLSINDNPINCTPEQIEFGYQIWREHPASFVGYFTNAVSCVSTFGPTPKSLWSYLFAEAFVGSGFYHKYYGHLFHNWLSPELRNYINLQGMCEDIAMNVLIMSLTGSYPIKLVPRNAVSPRCSNDRSNPTVLNSTVSSCIGDFFSLSGLNYSLSQRYLDAVVYQYIPLFMDNKS
ncbi:hypothetical protein AB6A40_004085 [Gnathostoma spinigerum]|uniref:Glycosyl transferase 64 domain-containing protein n=1 Tax=Gnathostoma spinigerum TaxID=75299 RepID=A0ABD6ECJ2_9BILA